MLRVLCLDDGTFVELADGLMANELKSLYNRLSRVDVNGKRIVYTIDECVLPSGITVYRLRYAVSVTNKVLSTR